MLIAFTRHVSPSIGNCELTYLNRVKIDISKAAQQPQSYEMCLRRNGVQEVASRSDWRPKQPFRFGTQENLTSQASLGSHQAHV